VLLLVRIERVEKYFNKLKFQVIKFMTTIFIDGGA